MVLESGDIHVGISADYHDAAAAVVIDGRIVAAAAEERFSRIKHDASLPEQALAWCLREAGAGRGDIRSVTFASKPFTTYERILATQARAGPAGFDHLRRAVGAWSGSKLWAGYRIERTLRRLGYRCPPVRYAEHHGSHAAAAFYPSPFEEAAVLTMDGLGEWATTTIAVGRGREITRLCELRYPHSLGLFYSAFTAYCGFEPNEGEYKLMGLAPYGEPRFVAPLLDQVLTLSDDGAVAIDQRWLTDGNARRMDTRRLSTILDGPPRQPGAPLTEREADIARSVQFILEEAVLRMAAHAHRLTGQDHLVLAGGVALNCVANARLRSDGPFQELWVQPAAGDDGGALGAALWSYHQVDGHPRTAQPTDAMQGALLGPSFADEDIVRWLEANDLPFDRIDDLDDRCSRTSALLDNGAIVGWFQGRMEFGPRALGSRSILADPRRPEVVASLNARVKQREDFRPFAPAVLADHAAAWFDLDVASPHMLLVAPVRGARSAAPAPGASFGERLARERSAIPACTHVDGSARVQTVEHERSPHLHRLLTSFHRRTGCPVLLNTSFNGPGEPIVCTPEDAVRGFFALGLDALVLGPALLLSGAAQSRRVPANEASA